MAKPKRKVPTTVKFGAQGETLHQYVKDPFRIKIIIGPLGSGKTITTIQYMLERIIKQKKNANKERKSRWVVIRNTYPDLETTTIPDFREIFSDDFGVFKMSNPPRFYADFNLVDGSRVLSEIIFLALDQPEDIKKLRGTQLTGGWLNETKEIPKAALDMLDSRIGRYPSRMELGSYWHGILGDTNAPDEDHWLAELAEDTPKNWKIYIQPGGVRWINGEWVLNPLAENLNMLPEGYYDNIIQGKRKDWIQVNVENRFGLVKDGKPVHPDFSRDVHVSERPLPIEPGAVTFIGIDFGRTPAATFAQLVNNQWRVLRELVTEDMGAFKFGGILKRMMNADPFHGENMKWEMWGDPAGEQMAQTDDNTPFEMLMKCGLEAFPTFTNDFSIRMNSLDNLLTSIDDGQPRIIIDPSCKKLIRGLNGGYAFKRLKISGDERYKDLPDKNMHSHVVESLHYLLLGAGEAESVMGTMDGEAMEEVESGEDFHGWHPDFTGADTGYTSQRRKMTA